MDKSIRLLIFSFFVLFSFAALAMVIYQPDLDLQSDDSDLSFLHEEVNPETSELPLPISVELPDIFDLPNTKGKLEKDVYDDHLVAAEQKGVGIIENEWKLFHLLNDKHLEEVNGGTGYQVENLTYSHPYLTPDAKKVLEEIGQMYEILAGEGNYITVSSVTRTMDQQKKLQKRNRNATSGNSSHSFGVSFDLSYIRFNGVKNYDVKAQRNLEKVLNHFQKAEKIYVIKERKQSCYHITVR